MRPFILISFLLASCADDRPPAPTSDEAARLDQAEAMLDNAADTQQGPADLSTGP